MGRTAHPGPLLRLGRLGPRFARRPSLTSSRGLREAGRTVWVWRTQSRPASTRRCSPQLGGGTTTCTTRPERTPMGRTKPRPPQGVVPPDCYGGGRSPAPSLTGRCISPPWAAASGHATRRPPASGALVDSRYWSAQGRAAVRRPSKLPSLSERARSDSPRIRPGLAALLRPHDSERVSLELEQVMLLDRALAELPVRPATPANPDLHGRYSCTTITNERCSSASITRTPDRPSSSAGGAGAQRTQEPPSPCSKRSRESSSASV